jgi:hypothetical protein
MSRKFTEYEPNATCTQDGKTERLFTYDSALSEKEAMKAIDCWRNDYKFPLDKAWIDVREDGQIVRTIEVAL